LGREDRQSLPLLAGTPRSRELTGEVALALVGDATASWKKTAKLPSNLPILWGLEHSDSDHRRAKGIFISGSAGLTAWLRGIDRSFWLV
jgi:hypothetical protein